MFLVNIQAEVVLRYRSDPCQVYRNQSLEPKDNSNRIPKVGQRVSRLGLRLCFRE